MSVLTSPPQLHPPHIRPSSRSERLLRDTLRRDDTLRTTTSPQSRARSRSRSACSCDSEDEDLFKSTLLFRSSRPNSVASVSSSRSRSRAHTHPKSRYIPDGDEHTSYVQLLRSPSFSGSLREPKSPQYTSLTLEKQEDAPPYVRDAPHEAVLRTRLEHVLHLGMREVKREKERGAGTSSIESSAGSPPSSLLSLSSSRHSHESEHTHFTDPEGDAQKPSTPPPHRGPHFTRSVSSAIPGSIQSPDLERAPKSPRSPLPTTPGRLSHSPQLYQKQNQPPHAHPSSPRLTTPLPSPSVYATTPTKRASPVMASVDATPPSLMYQAHSRSRTPAPIQSPPRSPPPHRSYTQATQPRAHPHTLPAFDPKAASLACQKVPGYVSFASVAGLGAPPDEDDRHSGRTIGLGFGGGKWWSF